MAEACDEKEVIVIEDSTAEQFENVDCPICLQSCMHPVKLPCNHIFCYLCVKGVANKNSRCALCRREIPTEFLEHPQLVHGVDEFRTPPNSKDFQWFYEGRNGWWQYDSRTSQEIEEAYKSKEKSCSILVAGFLYDVDFETMLQLRQNDLSRKRRVKRDLATIAKKGVAGLRLERESMAADPVSGPVASKLLSTIAATDEAIRIVTDIIDSTLAHVDDVADQPAIVAVANTSATPDEPFLQQADEILRHFPDADATGFAGDDFLAQAFRNITIRNIVDSSESEDDTRTVLL